MPKVHLTEITVRNLPSPERGQITYWCDMLPGFSVRCGQGGSRVFMVMQGKERRRYRIGRYPEWSLQRARTEAKRIIAEVSSGPGSGTSVAFSEGLDQYFKLHCKGLRKKTVGEYERLLRGRFEPVLGKRRLDSITTEEITGILDKLIDIPSEADHAHAVLRGFLRWCIGRRWLRYSPIEGLGRPGKSASRDRVLNDAELSEVMKTAEAFGYPYGTINLLLILTAQRRGEIAGLRWEYINEQDQTIKLPASVTKNKREHTFPYGAMCRKVIEGIPKKEGFLFGARGNEETVFAGWSRSKRAFDKECPIDHWTLHDLRRTVATNLAELGTQPHVTERLLNHASGTVSDVAAIYNRYAYMKEMREALDQWERKLQSLIWV